VSHLRGRLDVKSIGEPTKQSARFVIRFGDSELVGQHFLLPHFTNRKGEERFTAMAFEYMESRIKTSVNYEQII